MAYDENLAKRIRAALPEQPDIVEKKMFGGIAWMLNGNMACGVIGDELMVRVGPEGHGAALDEPDTHQMLWRSDHRPMRGMVMVTAAGVKRDEVLHGWIDRTLAFAATLPPK